MQGFLIRSAKGFHWVAPDEVNLRACLLEVFHMSHGAVQEAVDGAAGPLGYVELRTPSNLAVLVVRLDR